MSSKSDSPDIKRIFSRDVIIILAKELQASAGAICFQDYIQDGVSFIPIFTSREKLTQAFDGQLPDKPVIKIQGAFFASLLNGDEIVKVNPWLESEIVLPAPAITNAMQQEIKDVNRLLEKME